MVAMARLRSIGLALAILLLAGSAPASGGACTCPVIQELDGWCEVHAIGYIAGLEIHSQLLFEVLDAHGHEVDLDSFDCPGCRRAIETTGFCEEHRIGFVRGLAYFSKLTFLVARARSNGGAGAPCPACKTIAAAGGWCEACGVGFAGPVVFHDRRDFDEVSRALDLVGRADALGQRCEHCAVAMATDSICVPCKLEYRNGEPHPFVPSAPAGPRDN
jgi:hypothetical protein